jgi:rubrerythrin|nr:MAG TPA_asm: DNA-directed RNA polymerase [Caudoviricetes sp.]
MISDEKRREVVRTLRGLDESIDERGESRPLEHDAMLLRAIRAVVGKGDIFHLLAELIDRPTCSMEYRPELSGDEIYPTEVYRCSRCGWFVNEGKTEYCPSCGAEVLDEDSVN